MTNFERVSETVSSWIVGLATMSNCMTSLARDHPFLPRLFTCRRRTQPSAFTAGLDAAALPGPAPVVRHRRDVVDAEDLESRRGERPDGRLATGTRPLP